MGCLTRAVSSAIVVVGIAGAWWWWSGGALPLPEAVAARIPFPARGADSMSTAPARGLATARWMPIDDAGFAEARRRVSALATPGGPSMVTLDARALLSFLVEPFRLQLPPSAQAARVAVADGLLYIKADVPLEDLGGSPMLRPLVGMLNRRDTVILGGSFDLVDGQRAQFLIQEVIIGEFSVPRPLVPRLVGTMRRGRVPEWVAENGYPVELPPFIGDIRIRRDRITVYRAEVATP
jgi:hypothetical protein